MVRRDRWCAGKRDRRQRVRGRVRVDGLLLDACPERDVRVLVFGLELEVPHRIVRRGSTQKRMVERRAS